MMDIPNNMPSDAKTKGTNFKDEMSLFYEFLNSHLVTCTMAAIALNIPQKHLTRYKRKYELANRLWVTHKAKCPITRRTVQWITCNEKLNPNRNQLKLFPNE